MEKDGTPELRHEPYTLPTWDFPMDHDAMMQILYELSGQYRFLRIYPLGYSLSGREIPMVRLGAEKGSRTVVYVGTHHAMEWITATLLLYFLYDCCRTLAQKERVYGYAFGTLFERRLICVVPMLNPDGVWIEQHGATGLPNEQQLIAMNRGNSDFSHWQANGRGVDLNHNYPAGFDAYKKLERENGITRGAPTRYSGAYPESEPECAALAALLRADPTVSMILTLHTQGEEIYYKSGGVCPPGAEQIAQRLAALSGYRLSETTGLSAYGGLTDWAIRELGCPSFTIECGHGENPLPGRESAAIYQTLRKMLFCAPMLIGR